MLHFTWFYLLTEDTNVNDLSSPKSLPQHTDNTIYFMSYIVPTPKVVATFNFNNKYKKVLNIFGNLIIYPLPT